MTQNSSLSFAVNSGVRQGRTMFAFLFIVIIDWLMRNVTEQQRSAIGLCTELQVFKGQYYEAIYHQ